ncbi:MAG: hypothetical protein HY208_05125 [Nitrospirae bacterium]|nr:hypothetical protein [Nitrospirota bacterium]
MVTTAPRSRRSLWWLAAGVVVLVGAWWLTFHLRGILIFGLRDDYRQAVPYQAVPAGLTSLRAESCGQCHQAIYEEWKTSIHAHAFVDPLFQAYWRKDRQIWICLNCHAPLENQQPLLIKGLVNDNAERPITEPNPRYDAEYQLEGITCATCHVRDGVVLGPFDDAVAPHPTRYDPRFRTTEICYTCHQVKSGALQFYNGGPCATFFEFEGGPYAKRGYVCQNCHMPEIERPIAVGGPVRQGRQHLWRGGHSPEMIQRALEAQLVPPATEVRAGGEARFLLQITNAGAGHSIPTGDPDRSFQVELELKDANGTVIRRQSHTISRWIIWRPVILEVFQNRIPPLQSRAYYLTYRMPDAARAAGMTVHAKVTYHILTEKAYDRLKSKYGLTEEVPHAFTIFEQTVPLTSHGPRPVVQTATATAPAGSFGAAAEPMPCSGEPDMSVHGGLS